MSADDGSPYQHVPAADELAPVPRYSWPVRIALGLSVLVILFAAVVGVVAVALVLEHMDYEEMRVVERAKINRVLEEKPGRFTEIELSDQSDGWVSLEGTVATDEDLSYLKTEVEALFGDDPRRNRTGGVSVLSE